eukprot:scaffold509_cov241-Prasinococcus_capsulatus_cf.AAC.1
MAVYYASQGNFHMLELLHKFGATLVYRNPHIGQDTSVLDQACSSDAKKGVQDLCQLYFGGMTAFNEDGMTPLHYAATHGQLSAVTYLAKLGGDINIRDQRGYTPLMSAAVHGHALICKSLLQDGADWYAEVDGTHTALTLASSHGHQNVMAALANSTDPSASYLREADDKTNALIHAAVSQQGPSLVTMQIV